ncbi:hypothetical protein HHK36_024454 [Tetracentron sinense]|uniref:Uncharacterized protein n=1 Tax=Tetracentron sinense TaxID=13715 RepID=A0A834YL15_TETSI|nr:hypothetical protein HHK36_024454 [Tetracentron sinense]
MVRSPLGIYKDLLPESSQDSSNICYALINAIKFLEEDTVGKSARHVDHQSTQGNGRTADQRNLRVFDDSSECLLDVSVANCDSYCSVDKMAKLCCLCCVAASIPLKPESDQINSVMESGHGSGSSGNLMAHPDATIDEVCLLAPEKNSGSSSSPSSSSSSSSSDSSLEDFFQVDADELSKSTAETSGSPILDDDVQSALEDGEKDVPSDSSPKYELSDHGSPGPGSPEVSFLIPDFSLHNGSAIQSPMQSPPIQVMGRSGDLDSYRIPSSVFARSKSTTPLEWSVASNESLFSIHVGNNSFSGDQVFLLGRSGELGKSGELTKSGELINFSPRPPLETASSEIDERSADMGEGLDVTEAAAETMKDVLRATAKDRSKEQMPPVEGVHHSSSISNRSDGSGTSIQSFAFPMKFPALILCPERRNVHGHSATVLIVVGRSTTVRGQTAAVSGQTAAVLTVVGRSATVRTVAEEPASVLAYLPWEGGRSGSGKVDSEQHKSGLQTTGVTPHAARSKWCHCCSCCPLRC